jgi:hypothetical protein
VATYLTLNVVVVAVGLWHLAMATHLVTDWAQALSAQHGSPLLMVAMALLVFPKSPWVCPDSRPASRS